MAVQAKEVGGNRLVFKARLPHRAQIAAYIKMKLLKSLATQFLATVFMLPGKLLPENGGIS